MEKNCANIYVFGNEGEISEFLLSVWRETAEAEIARKNFFTVALSGGTTPEGFYRRLAGLQERELWHRTHVFLADERLVPYNHMESNFGMMKALFLDQVGIRAANTHEVATGLVPPAKAAAVYEEEIRNFFTLSDKQDIPVFDMVLLGIGEDGHTASLFPGGTEITEKKRLAVAVKRDGEDFGRISLTLRVINKAKNVIFLVTGMRKAEILKRVIRDNDASLPASKVVPEGGRLILVLDRDAASLLSRDEIDKDKYKFITQDIRED
jgi:6-phosphogluconolactonase